MDFKFKAMDCRLCANKANCSDYEDPTMNPGLLSKACSEFKPMAPEIKTNGDRIRAMTDEELACFLAGKFTDFTTQRKMELGEIRTATAISEEAHIWRTVWMQWLRMPVEDV